MDEIERLLELGHKDLEAGCPEYTREYFEKVLALDATNREAVDALARIDALRRRPAVPVKPIQGEPPPRQEIQPAGQKAEPPKQRLKVIKRFARLFGTLAVFGSLLFVLLMSLGVLIDADILVGLAIVGFYAALLFGALWFACWALNKLWK